MHLFVIVSIMFVVMLARPWHNSCDVGKQTKSLSIWWAVFKKHCDKYDWLFIGINWVLELSNVRKSYISFNVRTL